MITYAGIGARSTPEVICRKMSKAGKAMAEIGFCLRSGGASGADSAFESGVLQSKSWKEWAANVSPDAAASGDDPFRQIYLPYRGFNGHRGTLFGTTKAARDVAKQYHPRWDILSCLGRDFMGRNAYQILGRDLDEPVSFVLCWTPDGKITGGTGQALRHAKDLSIPILNLATDDDDYINDFILNIRKE